MPDADNEISTPPERPPSVCFACRPDHPHGLRLKFAVSPDGTATAAWIPTEDWQGFNGVIHGGIVTTVLDEAMAKAVSTRGYAFTGEIRVRFRQRVAPGEDLTIRGWIVECSKRVIRTEAALATNDGRELAHAWASFLPATGKTRAPAA
jgi:acyl-coenzyme A thioesterase PaaI-like protein